MMKLVYIYMYLTIHTFPKYLQNLYIYMSGTCHTQIKKNTLSIIRL